PAIGWIAFAIAAYAMGHVLFGVGAVTLDPLYDFLYKNSSGKFQLRRERAYSELERLVGFKKDSGDNALDWTTAILSLRTPGAFMQLDHIEADSKFLRNLVLTLVMSWPLLQLSRSNSMTAGAAGWLVSGTLAGQAVLGWFLSGSNRWDTRLKFLILIPPACWLVGVIVISILYRGDSEFVGIGIVSALLA